MKFLMIVAAIMFIPFAAQSHEGKTEGYACHKDTDGYVHCHILED